MRQAIARWVRLRTDRPIGPADDYLRSIPFGASIMDITTRRARVTGPVPYRAGTGRKQNIPIGPCLVESIGGPSIDVIWGARGQSSVALPVEEIATAQHDGRLVFLD